MLVFGHWGFNLCIKCASSFPFCEVSRFSPSSLKNISVFSDGLFFFVFAGVHGGGDGCGGAGLGFGADRAVLRRRSIRILRLERGVRHRLSPRRSSAGDPFAMKPNPRGVLFLVLMEVLDGFLAGDHH